MQTTNRGKVLITGAASDIGRATCIRFAGEGYDICRNDLQTQKLEFLAAGLPEDNHLILPGQVIAVDGRLTMSV